MKIALITGASSGLGREFVKQIAAHYKFLDEIWVIGREKKRLDVLQRGVSKRLRSFSLDLEKKEELEKLKIILEKENPRIKILVNSAGIGKSEDFSKHALTDISSTLRLNCEALTSVTYLTLPYLHSKSRIVQMASAAAFLPQPGFAVYAASKAYVLSFSRALRRELSGRGITVTSVCPGPVDTPFLEKAGNGKKGEGWKEHFIVKTKAVVKKAVRDAAAGKEMSVYGKEMLILEGLSKIMPHSFLLWIMEEINENTKG